MIEQLLTYSISSAEVGEIEFLGEVGVTDFIDGLALATQIGLTAGTAQHSNEPWLHFILDDVELYVAKKPYRHSLSWNQINAAGAVFGSRTVVINGREYKVRLLKSAVGGDVYTGSNGYDPVGVYDSEWNRIMYPIHSTEHTDTNNPSPVSGEGIRFSSLAQYTDTDLVVYYTAGNGSYNWCQETPSADSTRRAHRGGTGVSYLAWTAASHVERHFGWRPVLELVS